ncbi:uncharacterized protein PgNI_11885 [Pyricularia grisea]|uniref:General alpha-glucoside permease n=1 Tax=Pyricularia grisea TaxID=148305 RepID=A0A6P8AR53_PYRGI|nr:uncharacterized protein PgNI_11885 [Pyricularia grisea]TLD04534.1 hypothetical protein PgNI_11885 [Pyricularia grisea]
MLKVTPPSPCPSPTETLVNGHEPLLFEFDQNPIEPLSTSRLILITCPSLGVQICWYLLQSSGTPYLLSLGMTPFSVTLTWALGPTFGVFVQPVIGNLSDLSQHPYGRRKPVMFAGAVFVISSMLLMAFAPEFGPATQDAWQPRAVAVGFLAVILLAMNAYSVGVRAVVVDVCPPAQQPDAAAWSMRWSVLGSTLLSASGFVSAVYAHEAGPVATFRTLACVAAVCSAATVGLVCYLVPESASTGVKSEDKDDAGRVLATCLPGELARRWRRMPPLVGRVCEVQFAAWFGWFPVLYYMSTYESPPHPLFMPVPLTNPALSDATHPHPEADAKPYRLYASLAFSLGTFFSTVLLFALSHATALLAPQNLPRLWLFSQSVATSCLLLTTLLHTSTAALGLVALVGATWAVTMWIPFALINRELATSRVGVAGVHGLHNMAISLPQLASGLICAVLLAALGLLGVQGGSSLLLRLAAVPVGWSAWLIWRLD